MMAVAIKADCEHGQAEGAAKGTPSGSQPAQIDEGKIVQRRRRRSSSRPRAAAATIACRQSGCGHRRGRSVRAWHGESTRTTLARAEDAGQADAVVRGTDESQLHLHIGAARSDLHVEAEFLAVGAGRRSGDTTPTSAKLIRAPYSRRCRTSTKHRPLRLSAHVIPSGLEMKRLSPGHVVAEPIRH